MANIVILSDVRTGSSLACEAFESFKNTSTLHDLFWYNGQVMYDIDTNRFPENLRGLLDEEKIKLKEIIKTKRDIFKNDNVSRLTGNTNSDLIIARYLHSHPKEFFESVIEACSPNHIVFKTHLYIWKVTDLDWLFNLPNTYFIVLDRKSRLAQYTSLTIANNIKKWSRYNTSKERVTLDPMEFQEFKRLTDRGYNHFYINELKKCNSNYLNLYYEDDLENLEPDLFLERNNSVFPKRMVKQNSTPLESQIINFEDVIQFVQNEPKNT